MGDDRDQGGMELQTFIAETLRAIIDGVHAAQGATTNKGHNAFINPAPNDTVTHTWPPQEVEFDVAVTVSGGSNLEGSSGARLKVPVFQIGASVKGASSETDSRTSRVRFKVPVSLPSTVPPRPPELPTRIRPDFP